MSKGETAMDALLNCIKALADIQRIRITYALSEGELCLCSLQEILELSPSTVSRHVSVLKQAGLVVSRTEGKWRYFRLAPGLGKTPEGDLVKWLVRNLEGDPEARVQAEKVALLREQQHERCASCSDGQKKRQKRNGRGRVG
ncbi:MAG TPA: metalloregulator ArsR/SmtB family transcription factor [Synergistales bacterium]|nr:metalloregulator ArsR/SmtB family transcription factor [Synergistales bacterium]HQQ10067.1 metalloregulator ArsR/SmtB family transcription factor [Synergistales bacterium]